MIVFFLNAALFTLWWPRLGVPGGVLYSEFSCVAMLRGYSSSLSFLVSFRPLDLLTSGNSIYFKFISHFTICFYLCSLNSSPKYNELLTHRTYFPLYQDYCCSCLFHYSRLSLSLVFALLRRIETLYWNEGHLSQQKVNSQPNLKIPISRKNHASCQVWEDGISFKSFESSSCKF